MKKTTSLRFNMSVRLFGYSLMHYLENCFTHMYRALYRDAKEEELLS